MVGPLGSVSKLGMSTLPAGLAADLAAGVSGVLAPVTSEKMAGPSASASYDVSQGVDSLSSAPKPSVPSFSVLADSVRTWTWSTWLIVLVGVGALIFFIRGKRHG
jgi:hypothetical protein